MQDREKRRYDMFLKVDAFGRDYLADLAANSKGAAYKKTIADVIAELDSSKVQQIHPRATAIEVLFDALLLDMKAIAKTARAIQQDKPGFAESFAIGDQSPAALLTAADSFIVALKKDGIAQQFIDHEAAPDFVQNLEADVTIIRKSQAGLASGNTTATGKTKAIGVGVREGIKAVNYLDAIVVNKYQRNAEVLRAWQTASHVERAPRRDKNDDSTNGTVPNN